MRLFRNEKAVNFSLKLYIIFLVSLYIFWNFNYLRIHLNSEVSFEMILAHQVSIEKTIFPTGIRYAYELSALRPVSLAGFLDLLFHNIIFSYAVSLCLILLLIVASIQYMLKMSGLSENSILLVIVAILSMGSYEAAYCLWVFNGYYGLGFIVICYSLGYFARIEQGMKCGNVPLTIFAIIAFIFGLMGVRMILWLYLPLSLYMCWQYVVAMYNGRRLENLKDKSVAALLPFTAAILGFLVFNYGFKKYMGMDTVPSDMNFISAEKLTEKLNNNIISLLSIAGMSGNIKVLSLKGVAYGMSFLCLLVVIIVAFYFWKWEHANCKSIIFILYLSLFLSFGVLVLVNWKTMARYYFLILLLIGIILGCIYERSKQLKEIFLVIICVAGIINIVSNIYPRIISPETSNESNIIECCLEKGYNNGLGVLCGLSIGPASNFDINLSYIRYSADEGFVESDSMSSELAYYTDEPTFIMMSLYDYQQNAESLGNDYIIQSAIDQQTFEPWILFFYDSNPLLWGKDNE